MKRRSSTSSVPVQTLSPERVVSELLRHLNQEQIEDATAGFASDFRYQDHGIALEFREKERLTEFFRKAGELYPDYFVRTDQMFVSGEHVTTPFYGGLTWNHPLSLPGVSIVRVDNGKIAEWDDYYDGLTSRRTSLGAHFTEWIEY